MTAVPMQPPPASDHPPPTPLGPDERSAAALLAGVLDSAMDAVITIDEQQRIRLYNRAAESIFGWSRQEMLGQPMERLLPQRFRPDHGRHIERFGQTGVTTRQMGLLNVIHGLRSNGQEFPMDASISQLETAEGKLYTVILRDVTERVRAQQERRAFAAAANAIREQEKTRVARELHDELAQSLTVLKMDANWVRDHFATDIPASAAKLTEMLGVLDHTIAATRRIASDLRPLLLDDLGLQPAIEWLAANFSARYKVPCKLQLRDDLELAEPYATAIFRIVQESLANVGKHAHATRVEVVIEPRPGAIDLTVIDDGRGYDPDAPRKAQSVGLMGVRERVHLLHGSVTIATRPGHGTRIEVRIPLPAAGPV